MKLTNKQKRFCQEYLIDLNATKAAIRSGYCKKKCSIDRLETKTYKVNIKMGAVWA